MDLRGVKRTESLAGVWLVGACVFVEEGPVLGECAVDVGGRGEDEGGDAVLVEQDEEVDEPVDVVAVVLQRGVDALFDLLEGGEVDDSDDPRLPCRWVPLIGVEELPHGGRVAVVDVVQRRLGTVAVRPVTVQFCGQQDPGEDMTVAVAQVVDDEHIVSRFQQLQTGVAADESEAASDQDILLAVPDGRQCIQAIRLAVGRRDLRKDARRSRWASCRT